MKHSPLFFVLSLILLAGCSDSKSVKKSSSTDALCMQNYYAPGCPGYPGGTTTGGTSGGTTGNCPINPRTGTCFPNYPSSSVTLNWKVKYPHLLVDGSVPSYLDNWDQCSPTSSPSGISYTPYETRKASIMLAGKNPYDPASGQTYNSNTSASLQSLASAKDFYWGDSVLKVRFKPNLQPNVALSGTSVCPGRKTQNSDLKGYTKLKFDVELVGENAVGIFTESLGEYTIDILKCNKAIDLRYYIEKYPYGLYLKIKNVRGNTAYWPTDYQTQGFLNMTKDPEDFVAIRDADCWTLDVEVAADGTKTFN